MSELALKSKYYLMFGLHSPERFGDFKANFRRVADASTGLSKRAYVGEMGQPSLPHFAQIKGEQAVRNAEACLRDGVMNQALKVDLEEVCQYMEDIAMPTLQTYLRRNEAAAEREILLTGDAAFAMFLFAARRGFQVSNEKMQPDTIFLQWLANTACYLFHAAWQGSPEYDFEHTVTAAEVYYEHTYNVALLRDQRFARQLEAVAADHDLVVTQRGISHQGFFERTMPEAEIISAGQPCFTDELYSLDVSPDRLTDYHRSQIIKEIAAEALRTVTGRPFHWAVDLLNKLSDNLSVLERFFMHYNRTFVRARDAELVFRQMAVDLMQR